MQLVKVVSFGDTSNTMLYSMLKLVGLFMLVGFIIQMIVSFFLPIYSDQVAIPTVIGFSLLCGMYLGMCVQKQKDDMKYAEGDYK